MKIVVISDTHIPKKAKRLPEKLLVDLAAADLIIHAGDWQTIEVYEEIKQYGQIAGVYGNVDGKEIMQMFPDKILLECNGYTIGVVHGHGKTLTTEQRALAAFEEENVDCIIFGHSHIPVKKYINNILLFNPGSPTDKRRQPCYSYGILTAGTKLHAEHVFFESK
ncbi:metallophosphoesterase [Bacillus sp. 165]|uniref:metallophosphoesterase family protein n=1 Tax=Bacillus sp. 165 TaxID=1529117 RepID=UPI001ADC2C8A|nr:metallophosphoesterase [Bacillus sp. 165]MBO9129127.1 metallophosphoesterase [Bacillus sp. 165]